MSPWRVTRWRIMWFSKGGRGSPAWPMVVVPGCFWLFGAELWSGLSCGGVSGRGGSQDVLHCVVCDLPEAVARFRLRRSRRSRRRRWR